MQQQQKGRGRHRDAPPHTPKRVVTLVALARGATDLQVRYRLGSAATLVAEVQNLGETDLVFVRRFPFGDLLATRAERGRVLWIGASMER